MVTDTQREHAAALRRLHQSGTLVLPNAWDAGSARLVEVAGAAAVATTSAGVSWALSLPDGQAASREEMVAAVGRIVEVVSIPVSADIEGGYGDAPEDVAATVEAVIEAGAAGINLEDSIEVGGPLFSHQTQVERLQAARSIANHLGLPQFVINARTDSYLFEIGDPVDRLAETLGRAQEYAKAGADVLFVPGVGDLATLEQLVMGSPIPVNTLAGAGTSLDDLRRIGV